MNQRTAGSVRILREVQGIHGRVNQSEFLKGEARINGPLNRSEFLKEGAWIYEPPNRSEFLNGIIQVAIDGKIGPNFQRGETGIHGRLERSDVLRGSRTPLRFKKFLNVRLTFSIHNCFLCDLFRHFVAIKFFVHK